MTTITTPTTAPALLTTMPKICDCIANNDFCETSQIPSMVGNRPRTHLDKKGGLGVCGTGADVRDVVCVQTNK